MCPEVLGHIILKTEYEFYYNLTSLSDSRVEGLLLLLLLLFSGCNHSCVRERTCTNNILTYVYTCTICIYIIDYHVIIM